VSRAKRIPAIEDATSSYESWLASQTLIVLSDLEVKHEKMAKDPFAFLRGTFYRWVQVWPVECRGESDAPRVAAVGDLHSENFGTWRDLEGRLIWGTNDFDEACTLPYTSDLIRLGTSVLLAIETNHLSIQPRAAVNAILEGYIDTLDHGGRPFVVERDYRDLRKLALRSLGDPRKFWPKLLDGELFGEKLPKGARKALEATLPTPTPQYEIRCRTAGVGSLGRQRFVATALVGEAPIAREAKARVPPATAWAELRDAAPVPNLPFQAVRVPDPYFDIRRRWVVRRLSPDCNKIDLGELHDKGEQAVLLKAMGSETANVHLGSTRPSRLLRDLQRRKDDWLCAASERMAKATEADCSRWRRKM
jgi:Uncharacterized protein conserved in bacteria (DUF2252)